MSKRKTQDEYIKEVAECNPYVEGNILMQIQKFYMDVKNVEIHGCKSRLIFLLVMVVKNVA